MGIIHIKFGYPTSTEGQELLSNRAVENDCSVEHALCFEFECLTDHLVKPKNNENFFDLVFLIASQKQVISPKVTYSSYIHNRNRLPMLVLDEDYLISRKDSLRISITKKMIDELGQIYQTEFDYEYVGFERVPA